MALPTTPESPYNLYSTEITWVLCPDQEDLEFMAPVKDSEVDPSRVGPAPSFIQVAKPYMFEQTIQECLKSTGVSQLREDNIRLAGVQWIDNVRKALRLPVRTFNTAVVYYHKFRLMHADNEYSYVDAAAAALFTACKIEDTLKKSRDILCAAYNLKLAPAEHLSPDDPLFEQHSRAIIGLERLMLEASGFDFRGRHPQELFIKLAKFYGVTKTSDTARTAWGISIDIYRTFAPLKQTTATMAFSCLELAGRLLSEPIEAVESGRDYKSWRITRAEVMEILLDLLELYTHYRTSTTVGPQFTVDTFLEVRIPLNQEVEAKKLPRFTEWTVSAVERTSSTTNGHGTTKVSTNGTKSSHLKDSPSAAKDSPISPIGGTGGSGGSMANTSAPTAANSASMTATPTAATSGRGRVGERGRDGTVRFMLNPDRELAEREVVAQYFRPLAEDEVEEMEADDDQVDRNQQPAPAHHQHQQPHHSSQNWRR